jgi:hypothetical protein
MDIALHIVAKFQRRAQSLAVVGLLGALLPLVAAEPSDRPTLFAFDLFFRQVSQSQSATTQAAPTSNQLYLQSAYDLSGAAFAQVAETAATYTSAVAAIDAKATAIISAAKAKYRVRGAATGQSVPPVPSELQDLQQQKENLIRSTLGSLTSSLGPAQVSYLTSVLMQHISVQPAGTGTPQ